MPGAQVVMTRELRLRAVRACAVSEAALAWSNDLMDKTAAVLNGGASLGIGSFVLHGRVESRAVWALRSGGHLTLSPLLRERAEVVVALGEHFAADGVATVVTAGLDEPLAALLTLIRACDQVKAVSVCPPTPVCPVSTDAGA